MPNVARLYSELGDVYARAAEGRRQFWGQAIAGITGIPSQIIAAKQAQQKEQRKAAYDDAHLALERANFALKAGEIRKADEEYALSKQLNEYQGQVLQAAQGEEPGSFDVQKARQAAMSLANVNPAVAPKVMAWVEEQNKHYNPAPVFHPPGSQGVNPVTGQPVAGAEIPEKITPGTLGGFLSKKQKELGRPLTSQDVLDATREYKTAEKGPESQSEWTMFAQSYAGTRGKPAWSALTPAEQQQGFSQFAQLKADPAAQRQATAINAQAAQQGRAQTFSEQQVGRKELTDRVETPYHTSVSSADTLRETVKAAQAGNKVAGSLQALETTFAAVRAQGLNRVNMAEIGLPANAGSVWDRLQSWWGKKSEGQPIPADIQKDMLSFADILERAAYKKYVAQHQTVTKRYGLTDETPLPPPVSATPPDTAATSPGLSALKKRP